MKMFNRQARVRALDNDEWLCVIQTLNGPTAVDPMACDMIDPPWPNIVDCPRELLEIAPAGHLALKEPIRNHLRDHGEGLHIVYITEQREFRLSFEEPGDAVLFKLHHIA